MPELVYVVAEERFEGDLSALSREAHVWVWLSDHNRARYRQAVDRDVRAYSPHYGLSGFHGDAGALETLYLYLGTIDQHHGDDACWDELHIIGITAAELDQERVQRELGAGRISLSQEDGHAVVKRLD